MVVYSDSTVRLVSSGFEVDPLIPRGSGIYPVTLRYEDLSVSYDVQVLVCPVAIEHSWPYTLDWVFSQT